MSDQESTRGSERYEDCSLFVSPAGKSGFALGRAGDRAGELYDFFVSPEEQPGTADGLMSLALQQGTTKLVTYKHPLLAKFFEQFAFQAVSIVRPKGFGDVPPGWMPESASESDPRSWPDFLYMMRLRSRAEVVGFDVLEPSASSSPVDLVGTRQSPCARCGQLVVKRVGFGVFAGYDCPGCRFIYICGTLTMGPRERSRPP